jgi:hypothetical protein
MFVIDDSNTLWSCGYNSVRYSIPDMLAIAHEARVGNNTVLYTRAEHRRNMCTLEGGRRRGREPRDYCHKRCQQLILVGIKLRLHSDYCRRSLVQLGRLQPRLSWLGNRR